MIEIYPVTFSTTDKRIKTFFSISNMTAKSACTLMNVYNYETIITERQTFFYTLK